MFVSTHSYQIVKSFVAGRQFFKTDSEWIFRLENDSVGQKFFLLYWEPSSQYKTQIFIVMRTGDDGKRSFRVGNVLLLFRLKTVVVALLPGRNE